MPVKRIFGFRGLDREKARILSEDDMYLADGVVTYRGWLEPLPPVSWDQITGTSSASFTSGPVNFNRCVRAMHTPDNINQSWGNPFFIWSSGYDIWLAQVSDITEAHLNRTAAGSTVTYSHSEGIAREYYQKPNFAPHSGMLYWTNTGNPLQVHTTYSSMSIGSPGRFQDARWDDSANTTWRSRTAGGVTCLKINGYREYLVALNTTEGGSHFPQRVRWSHRISWGNQPASWEDSRLDIDAGYVDLVETPGPVLTCEPLGNANIVYKEDAVYIMQYIGGTLVMAFRKIFDWGIANPACVCNLDDRHIVFTKQGDLVEHNGQTWRSLNRDRIDMNFTAGLNNAGLLTIYDNFFLVHNRFDKEVYICGWSGYGSLGYFDLTASISKNYQAAEDVLIYNYRDDTFTEMRRGFKTSELAKYGVTTMEFVPKYNRMWVALARTDDYNSSATGGPVVQWRGRGQQIIRDESEGIGEVGAEGFSICATMTQEIRINVNLDPKASHVYYRVREVRPYFSCTATLVNVFSFGSSRNGYKAAEATAGEQTTTVIYDTAKWAPVDFVTKSIFWIDWKIVNNGGVMPHYKLVGLDILYDIEGEIL